MARRAAARDDDRSAGMLPDSESEGATVKYLSIPMAAEGRADLTRLGERKIGRLRQAVADPEFRAVLGLDVPGPAAQPQGDQGIPAGLIDDTVTGILFSGVETVLQGLARRRGAPPDLARQVMTYSAEERHVMVPLTTTILNRWLPADMGKYKEEYTLALYMGAVTKAKFDALDRVVAQLAQQQRGPASVHNFTPQQAAEVAAGDGE